MAGCHLSPQTKCTSKQLVPEKSTTVIMYFVNTLPAILFPVLFVLHLK